MLKKACKGILLYLSDWKNWLIHSVVGISILGIALFLPVNVWIRVVILAIIVALNIFRMRAKKSKK